MSKENIYKAEVSERNYLDFSVAMWFQYLRSSIPVIVIAMDEIHRQRPPLFFSIQNSYN
jgi:hypothetical protein